MFLLICGLLIGFLVGVVISYKIVKRKMLHQLSRAEGNSDKHLAIVNLLSMWMQNKESGLKIEKYLNAKNIKTIAIYGMSFVGERLYDELENSNIKVTYCIDRNANNIYKDIDVKHPDDELLEVDAIIVTAFMYFEEIEKKLKEKTNATIISIDDIVYSL